MLSDSTVSRPDILPFAPSFETITEENGILVGDEMPWSFSSFTDGSSEERSDFQRRGLLLEDGEANCRARKMIDDHGHPPAERPDL